MAESPSKVAKLNDGGALRKQRNVSEELAAARETTRRIKGLDYSRFSDEGVTTMLPYPALDHVFAGTRPGKVVRFVGRRNLYPTALEHVLRRQMEYEGEVGRVYEGVVITGPSGSGKSCLIRAIACQLIATLPETTKVICFWYFNVFRAFHRQVQDALLFTYCNECEADTGLAQRILQIKDVQALRDFLLHRIDEIGEAFYVVTDGEERLDCLKSDGSERGNDASRRAEARLWLGTIYESADFEVKALSPKAEEASPSRRKSLFRWEVKELFQKVEVQTFLANTLLGRLLAKREKRWSDVEFFAGAHPLSLWKLQICCMEYVLAQEPVEKGQDWIHLFDKDSWSSVLASFRCGEPFQQIRESISLKGTDDISAADRSFRLGEGFCSDYIRTVYMEAVVKNAEARKFRCRELTDYVNMMLSRGVDFHNWSALGWACETFMGDAILKVGLTISGLEHVAPKTVVIMYGGQPTNLNVTKLKRGDSAYWTPARYSFKYIDGIILHMDKQGVIHLIALQDTVNPKEHRRTEYKFMQERHVQKWWASRETIQLHYVYICPQMPADMDRNFKVEKGHLVAGKKSELEYFVHVELMADCIPKMHEKEYELLRSLGDAREDAMKRRAKEKRERNEKYRMNLRALPDELQKMHDLKRAELEANARSKGILNPSKAMFPTKLELVKAINGL